MPKPGTTTQRGYGSAHAALREQWQPEVKAGRAFCQAATCVEPTRWIRPGSAWDLGHTPDRTSYTGPEHRKCNRRDGALRGNANRKHAPAAWTRSRDW